MTLQATKTEDHPKFFATWLTLAQSRLHNMGHFGQELHVKPNICGTACQVAQRSRPRDGTGKCIMIT